MAHLMPCFCKQLRSCIPEGEEFLAQNYKYFLWVQTVECTNAKIIFLHYYLVLANFLKKKQTKKHFLMTAAMMLCCVL